MKLKAHPPQPNSSDARTQNRHVKEPRPQARAPQEATPIEIRADPAPGGLRSQYFYTLSALMVWVSTMAMVINTRNIAPSSQLPSYDDVREQLDVVVKQCRRSNDMSPSCMNLMMEHQAIRSHESTLIVPEAMHQRLLASSSSWGNTLVTKLPSEYQYIVPLALAFSVAILAALYARRARLI